ncbi:Diphthamide biosynthesis protein 2 [Orbilia oligospora]|nr:Diphthamide biosynthesis protein 2 [Orbilia oligospora]KAF3233789.1 Diphthamide biosynthesis protein 2 [Orbilia oligospora]KAF3237494.1 Diphthamide biosynthesis protein 2 [Orbilia oligospora]KAF3288952.1 Diphthamide biosynthesis protein 2 [Orbilia oligospora]
MTQPELTTAPVLSTNPEYEPAAVQVETSTFSPSEIRTIYETDRTVDWILSNNYSRITLQFPDDLLRDSTEVEKALQDGLKMGRKADSIEDGINGLKVEDNDTKKDKKIYILADTSYGSCCVDEVAAEHAEADCIVHYGRACLSPTNRLPVLHIFTTLPLDLQALISSFIATFPDKSTPVVLTSSLPYSSHIPTVYESLTAEGYTSIFASSVIHNPSSPIPNRTCPSTDIISTYHILHIDQPLTSLILTLSTLTSSTSLQIFDPKTNTISSSASNRLLLRRYALLSHIRAAGIFGILINTLSSNNYLSTIKSLQTLLAKHYKKSYLVTVGKLNAAKLANFAEVEVWIVIGCWESAVVDERREMWRVVVTPWEATVALDGGEGVGVDGWRGDWEAFKTKIEDYQALQAEKEDGEEENGGEGGGSDDESEEPVFDFRTGRYISTAKPMKVVRTSLIEAPSGSNGDSSSSTALTTTRKDKSLSVMINNQISPAAEYLQQKRGWKGLGSDFAEVEYDQDGNEVWRGDEGAVVEEGRKGVARGYHVHEGETRT